MLRRSKCVLLKNYTLPRLAPKGKGVKVTQPAFKESGPTSAADLARDLGGRKSGTRSWSCRCPAHDDSTPSLSVTESADGRTLVYCHAGCGQDEVIDALRRRGLWHSNPPRGRAAVPKPKTKPPVIDPATIPAEDNYEHFSGLVESFVAPPAIETPENENRAARSTWDAVLFVLREHGVARLDDDWMRPRLAQFSPGQMRQLVVAMQRMRAKGQWPNVTDELIGILEGLVND